MPESFHFLPYLPLQYPLSFTLLLKLISIVAYRDRSNEFECLLSSQALYDIFSDIHLFEKLKLRFRWFRICISTFVQCLLHHFSTTSYSFLKPQHLRQTMSPGEAPISNNSTSEKVYAGTQSCCPPAGHGNAVW